MPEVRHHRNRYWDLGSRGRCGLVRLKRTVLQLLAAFMLFQTSGLATALVELNDPCTQSTAGCCTDCPMEQGGKECPPGCPSCHCSHGGVGLPSALESVHSETALEIDIELPPYEATVPRAPPDPGIYRPP